jgi:predicted chitinase
VLGQLAVVMPNVLASYGITSGLRFCHFIAQAAHETMGFQTLQELGGTAYFDKNYGPQTAVGKRLGNTQKGDGARYHGRGIFQLTGRTNYAAYGKRLGLDLIANPELAADPATSLRIACEYWKAHGLNALADNDDIDGITRRINGGTNGLASRKAYLAAAKKLWLGVSLSLPKAKPVANPPDAPEIVADAPIAMDVEPKATTDPVMLASAGGGVATATGGVLAALQNPYAFVAFLLVFALFGVIGFLWLKKHDYI